LGPGAALSDATALKEVMHMGGFRLTVRWSAWSLSIALEPY
jgi:hypothetical protein